MSGINRFLSRRDKHVHGKQGKEDVKPRHNSSPTISATLPASPSPWQNMASKTLAQRSSKPRHRSLPSVSSVSRSVSRKATAVLQSSDGVIECSSADRKLVLQPKHHTGPLNGLFVDDDAKKSNPEKEENKVKTISQRLARAGITNFKDSDIRYVLHADYAKGDIEKAYELIVLLEDSEEGIIQPYNPNVKMLGAINRQGVTCYLDALLFAMFARLGSFEAMLYKNFEDLPRKRLATLLRLWVNTLRAGKLITIDITKQIQLQLANCGWKEAAELCQQDASEAFTFITETLALPLLTLKMDIFHTGKEDASDDHKFVNERLLELAVPEDTEDGHQITLEECLELFFNNKIEVKRYLDDLQRRNTLGSVRSRASVSSTKGNTSHIEVAEVEEGQPSSPIVQNTMQTPMPLSTTSPTRPIQRMRAPSIIKESYVDEKHAILDSISEGSGNQPRVRKEVMMPAWQFFSLIPWYTNNMPSNDAQVAAHFSTARPILGICLKRYTFSQKGQAIKRTTHIDIPLEIGLPNFIQDDKMAEDGPAFGNFKLSLQSVVCHQGNSVDSGHYISIVRSPDPRGEGEDGWMRFDDLAAERVTPIDAEQFLKTSTEQTPYLLFYQVIPIEGDPGTILDSPEMNGGDIPPPSYADSTTSRDSKVDSGVSGLGPSTKGSYSQETSTTEAIRRSLDYSSRHSLEIALSEESRRGRRSTDRPPSVVFSDASNQSGPPINIESADNQPTSRRGSMVDGPNALTAERRGSNISNAKSSSKSRPTSSSGNNRISRSLSRLAGRMSRDKLSGTIAMTAPPSLQSGESPNMVPPPLPANASQTLQQLEQQLQQNQQYQQQRQQQEARITSSVGPSLTLVGEVDKASEKAKLKKEQKEPGRARTNHGHAHLSKAERAGKPDRECAVM